MRFLLFPLLALAIVLTPIASLPAQASDTMCGIRADYRTQTVSIDPWLDGTGLTSADVLAAFDRWNQLFTKYHGFPIFAPHTGEWQDADILLTAQGGDTTWVATPCISSFQQRGNNKAIVFVGKNDSWRNRDMIAHELGHALGLPDYVTNANLVQGHIGARPCGNYIGVMSYCTSPQSWFMDFDLAGMILDGQVVRDFWK